MVPMGTHRAAAAAALLALFLPAGASADVFVLRDGSRIDGFPAGTTPKKEIVLGTEKGPRTVPKDRVREILPSQDAEADYARYLGGLGPKDADGAAALGNWARERGLPERATEAFRRALDIRSDHPAARVGMGWLQVDGKWLDPDQAAVHRKEEEQREALRARYEQAVGKRPEVVDTAHWRCVDFLGDGKAPARLADLEKAWDETVRVLDGNPWKDRALVVACEGMEQYHRWIDNDAKTLLKMRPQFVEYAKKATGMKWVEPAVLGRSDLPSRDAMHAANVHASGHLLLNRWNGHNREQPFWIEEGFGGWIEAEVLRSNSSYCWAVEAKGYGALTRDTAKWDVDDPDWRALCRKAASRNEFLPLADLDALPASQYSRREVGQAFSFVAYLLKEKGPAPFQAFVAEVKRGTKSADAFRQAYRQGLADIEPDWKRWLQTGGW
jgi:hypothetical protein